MAPIVARARRVNPSPMSIATSRAPAEGSPGDSRATPGRQQGDSRSFKKCPPWTNAPLVLGLVRLLLVRHPVRVNARATESRQDDRGVRRRSTVAVGQLGRW